MIADPDLFNAADAVIECYGPGAAAHCAKRLCQHIDAGDRDGAVIWWAILQTIEQLQRHRRHGEPLN